MVICFWGGIWQWHVGSETHTSRAGRAGSKKPTRRKGAGGRRGLGGPLALALLLALDDDDDRHDLQPPDLPIEDLLSYESD